jgi:hypothetical protein
MLSNDKLKKFLLSLDFIYLNEDPDTTANAGNRPGDEEEKNDPEDSEDRILGHGEAVDSNGSSPVR